MSDKEKYKAHIEGELARGLVGKWRRCIGLHGTSVHTITYAINTGVVPGATAETYADLRFPQRGDLYYYPYPTRRILGLYDREQQSKLKKYPALWRVQRSAEILASIHHVLHALRLPIENPEFHSQAAALIYNIDEDVIPESTVQFFESQGVPYRQLGDLVREALQRKGVIFGIDKRALSIYPEGPGDPGNNDRRIMTSTSGMAINHLRGLVVLDTYSQQLLEDNLRTS